MNKPFAVFALAGGLLAFSLAACAQPESEPVFTATPARFVTPAPFNPAPTAAPVAPPLAASDAIQVAGASLQFTPPGECKLVENLAEPDRLGSDRAFDYKLNFGFGCPSQAGDVRLQEIQMHTTDSTAAYDTQCATTACGADRLTLADFDAQQTALLSGQAVPGWSVLDVSGRQVLARSVPVEGGAATMRQYAEFCGGVRVEHWVVMLGDPATLEASADSFFATVSLTCLAGG